MRQVLALAFVLLTATPAYADYRHNPYTGKLDYYEKAGDPMAYPGAGIGVSTGSAWGTSITDNSSNWNTAYGWGDWSTGALKLDQTTPQTVVNGKPIFDLGIVAETISDKGGTYPILEDRHLYDDNGSVILDFKAIGTSYIDVYNVYSDNTYVDTITANQVVYTTTDGQLVGSANLTYDGTTLQATAGNYFVIGDDNAVSNSAYFGIPLWFSSTSSSASPPVGNANIFGCFSNDASAPIGMVIKHGLDENDNPHVALVGTFIGSSMAPIIINGDYGSQTGGTSIGTFRVTPAGETLAIGGGTVIGSNYAGVQLSTTDGLLVEGYIQSDSGFIHNGNSGANDTGDGIPTNIGISGGLVTSITKLDHGTAGQVLRTDSAGTGFEFAEPTKDREWFRQVGTSPLERWYGNMHVQTNGMTTASVATGTLYAYPFISGRGGTLDRIAFNVTTVGGAGSVARVGIYTATSDTNLYPDALVVDGGEQNTNASTGVKSSNINISLTPNKLYWLVFLCGTSAPVVRGLQVSSMQNILGLDNTLSTANGQGLTVAQAYGALHATFPGSATVLTSTPHPLIAVRYSA